MSDKTKFNIVLSGQVIDGFERTRAVKSLAKLLNASEQQAEALLKGREKTVKKAISKDKAVKYKLMLASCGVLVRIEPSAGAAKPRKVAAANSLQQNTNVHHINEAKVRKSESPEARPVKSTSGQKGASKPGKVKRVKEVKLNKKGGSSAEGEQAKLQMQGAFKGPVQVQAVSLLQQMILIATCSGLLLLATLYAGLFLWTAFFSIGRIFTLLFGDVSASWFSLVLVYLLPALVSALIAGLFLRPILSSPKKELLSVELDKSERGLMNFAGHIAGMIGAPRPRAVRITDENCISAEFMGGLKNLRNGNIELKLGLPILMSLDVRTLSGVLAGEFTKFDDRVGMYMQYAIREVNLRLRSCKESDDQWQHRVDEFGYSTNKFVHKFIYPCCLFVLSLSSYLLLPFEYAVRVVSSTSSRQSCYRRDDCFARLAGSKAFTSYFSSLYLCSWAQGEAEKSIHAAMDEKKYVNDLPALILHAFKSLPDSAIAEVQDSILELSTQWNDLQPCNRDRIIAVEDTAENGLVILEKEAYKLLKSFRRISLEYTLGYYRHLGIEADKQILVAAREVASSSNEEKLRDEVCSQYYNGWFEPELFWQTNHFAYAKSISRQQRQVEINECIKILRRSTPDFIELKSEVPERFVKFSSARLAAEVYKAGYRVDASIHAVEGVALSELASINSACRREYEGRRAQQRDFCRVMGERLCFALAFLQNERELRVADVVLSMLSVLEAQANQLEALRLTVKLVPQYLERIETRNETEHLKRVRRLSRDIFTVYEMAMSEFTRCRWPFGKQFHSLADFISVYLPANIEKELKPGGSVAKSVKERIELYSGLWKGITEANRYLNGKIAPLAQKAELDNQVSQIKMVMTNVKAG